MKAQSMFQVRREELHNFTREENETLTRVGPATPMGNLFRHYWLPVVPTAHLKEPGGRPLRVRLLGEDLVLFRTYANQVGLIGAYCPHRLAPLYFGRVEQDGLRCPYHAWKYSPTGKCLEMPNIPPAQQFKDEVEHPGYPCVEKGGIIWTFMGRSKDLPELPDFEFLRVPDEHRIYRLFYQEANYLQVLEGGIDPTHVMWLHSPYDLSDEEMNAQQPAQQRAANRLGVTKTPEDVELFEREGGFTYGAKRSLGGGKSLWRVNQFIMPCYTMPPGADQRAARAFVPVDDENCVKWQVRWYPTKEIAEKTEEAVRESFPEEAYDPPTNSLPFGQIRMKARRSNDYLIDWDIHKSRRIGIAGVNLQDVCVTENEGPGPIMDRTKEHLCAGDISTIKARMQLLNAAKALREKGTPPPGARDAGVYRVRGASTVVDDDKNWIDGAKEATTVPPLSK
ncbi:MAG TPA: Rieske 2Fe-2S domain-containing protein [Acidobacteriota bacterium]|nr:Rieske 2Fe-2S domain-containing protein [Acidobacteriota bacterium]